MVNIYFVRHGESEANLNDTFAGQRDDSLLTAKGNMQAQETGKKLKLMNINFDKIISSPLQRAKQTAEEIVKILDYEKELEINSGIIEYDMGDLSGAKIRYVSSEELANTKNSEQVIDFEKRLNEFFINLQQGTEENILVVGHGIVSKMLKNIKNGNDPNKFWNENGIGNGEIIKIDWIK